MSKSRDLAPRSNPVSKVLRGIVAAAAFGAVLAGSSALAGKGDNRYLQISETLTARGNSALAAGKTDEARQSFEVAVVANPRNARAYSYLGLTAQRAGDKDLAKKYFALALEIDPNELNALSWGGQADLSVADLGGAEAKLQRLSRLCGPGCAEYKRLSDAVVSYKSKSSSN